MSLGALILWRVEYLQKSGIRLPPPKSFEFLDRQAGFIPVEHGVAVGTHQDQIGQSGFLSGGHLRGGFRMVKLDKPLSQIAVGSLEVEPADFAAKVPVFFQGCVFLLGAQLGIVFPGAVNSLEKFFLFPFFGFRLFVQTEFRGEKFFPSFMHNAWPSARRKASASIRPGTVLSVAERK